PAARRPAGPVEPAVDEPGRDRPRGRQGGMAGGNVSAREPTGVLQLAITQRDGLGARHGVEAQHQRRRKRPRLRGVVRDIADLYTGLLVDLAHYRFLETFAWLDEAGDGRVSAFRPRCLAAQQGTFA